MATSPPSALRILLSPNWVISPISKLEIGDTIAIDQAFGIVESVKAANDIFSPITGEVIERNDDALSSPETINASPYDRAWLVRVRVDNPEQIAQLMNAEDYDAFAHASAH